jgi:hypothetical protein
MITFTLSKKAIKFQTTLTNEERKISHLGGYKYGYTITVMDDDVWLETITTVGHKKRLAKKRQAMRIESLKKEYKLN